ncbi:MAG: ABC transporter ATP-binding protein [Opitutaceae bacterium]|jgi:iron complex transport system ATP-binding protein
MPTPEPLLNMHGLTVMRDRTTLLQDVAWRVERGEHWVILGPNGCGKTSLLKALTGYLTPSAGEIDLLGRRYGESDWRDLRLEIGLVTSALQASVPPDEPALETIISGKYAQLDLWMKITPADRRAAQKLLRFTGADALAERLWSQLSQGERQRILIARALMAKPKLLILDEPCAGLDPVAREQFLHFIEILARQSRGPALILVTHHVEEITPAFTHALLLKAGRVAASGPLPETLTSKNLSAIFDAPVKLSRRDHRLHLRLPARSHGMFSK